MVLGKVANFAVLKGEQVKIVDEHGAGLPDCPELLGGATSLHLARLLGPLDKPTRNLLPPCALTDTAAHC